MGGWFILVLYHHNNNSSSEMNLLSVRMTTRLEANILVFTVFAQVKILSFRPKNMVRHFDQFLSALIQVTLHWKVLGS